MNGLIKRLKLNMHLIKKEFPVRSWAKAQRSKGTRGLKLRSLTFSLDSSARRSLFAGEVSQVRLSDCLASKHDKIGSAHTIRVA